MPSRTSGGLKGEKKNYQEQARHNDLFEKICAPVCKGAIKTADGNRKKMTSGQDLMFTRKEKKRTG